MARSNLAVNIRKRRQELVEELVMATTGVAIGSTVMINDASVDWDIIKDGGKQRQPGRRWKMTDDGGRRKRERNEKESMMNKRKGKRRGGGEAEDLYSTEKEGGGPGRGTCSDVGK